MGKKLSFSLLTTLDCEVIKINLQNMLKGCSVIIIIFLLSGCAMSQKARLADSSTDYNLVVEKAQNEMLLLNIVRASKRHPMHFTALTQVRGSLEYNFQTGGISIPFGKIGDGLNGSYSVAPSISYSTKPSFDLAVLDNEKFMRGIMNPVSVDMFYYYWQQGWPKEMLMLLFVEKIEPSDKSSEAFDNNPLDKDKIKNFQNEVREIIKCYQLELDETPELFGPSLSAETAKDMKLLIEAQKNGLIIDRDKVNGYQFKKEKKNYSFKCKDANKTDCKDRGSSPKDSASSEIGFKSSGSSPKDSASSKKVIHLRSPEGILYYLGEIVRAQTEPKLKPITIDENNDCKENNLFVIDKSSTYYVGKSYSIAIDYEGIKYGIPQNSVADSNNKCPDRSMQALSLISQLIGLNKSVEQMPVTRTVNVIGR
ncbi:MAG: hypothetical protein NTW65_03935 [Deltaproteobacteria bacterium]|nr:hypothetical protein [Deltaproteobacteria bacterium]